MSERNVSPGPFNLNISPKMIVLILTAAAAALFLFSSIYIVDQTEEAVVLTLGKYNRTEGPGMRFKLPLGLEENFNVPTKTVQNMTFGFRTDRNGAVTLGGANYAEESIMLTGDLNIIDITWVIQYRITDPKAWLFNLDRREKTIRDISQSVINQFVGDRAILDVMGPERNAIEIQSQTMMNDLFKNYGVGITVTQVRLKDIVPPKGTVQAAFEDVNVATQDMNRLINEGREAYNKEIPKADGEGKQLVQIAEGYAAERLNKAKGDVSRFNAMYNEYRKNPEVTRTRLYYEMMENVFGANQGTDLIDKSLGSFLPLKNLGDKKAPAGGTQ